MGELTWRARRRLWARLGTRLALWALGALFVWKGLPALLGLCWPFLGALAVAALLNRPVGFLRKKLRLRRGASSVALVALAVGMVAALAAGLIYLPVTQAAAALEDWPDFWADVASGVEQVGRSVEELIPDRALPAAGAMGELWSRAAAWLGEAVGGLLSAAAEAAGAFALALPGVAFGLVVLVMAACAMSADYPRLRRQLARWTPPAARDFLAGVKRVAADAFGGCVRAELLLSAMGFCVMLVGFLLLREPYAVLLALALAVVDFIPVLGAGTVLIPWAVVEALRGAYLHAIGLAAICAAVGIVRRLAEPKVLGGQTGLSPLASLASVYVGMKLAGVVGIALGPVVWVVLAAMARDGVFDGALRDLRLAAQDLRAVLKGTPDDTQE